MADRVDRAGFFAGVAANADLRVDQVLADDRAFVASLMGRVAEPGKYANWIAPPARGINNQAVDFEYVRFN